MEISTGILFPLVLSAPMLLCIGILYAMRSYNSKRRALPFDIALVARSPGHSILSQLMDITWNIAFSVMFIFFSFIIPLAISGLNFYLQRPQASLNVTIILSIIIFMAASYYLLRDYKQLGKLRIGLEAEWAVGIKLNDLQTLGYKVFHDIQADNFNIDHLVVGSNGIFAIETKGRRKPLVKSKTNNQTREKRFNVVVKGSLLEFPTWRDTKSVAQTTRQAKWVSNWLTKATGQEIHASPVLIIPGWYIERKEKPSIPVLPHNNLDGTFPTLSGTKLDSVQIKQICYQVEQRVKRGDDTL